MKIRSHRIVLPDPELLSIPDEEEEADVYETTESENSEKKSSLQLPIFADDEPVPNLPWSDFSVVTTSATTGKPLSRPYRFVQLDRALTLASLLENHKDRIKFEHDYHKSLHENKFEEFLQTYYTKLQIHYEEMKREYARKRSRTFTFVDLETNFLALDPTRDIKIVFIDDPTPTPTNKNTYVS